jgi:hypothetical protein
MRLRNKGKEWAEDVQPLQRKYKSRKAKNGFLLSQE